MDCDYCPLLTKRKVQEIQRLCALFSAAFHSLIIDCEENHVNVRNATLGILQAISRQVEEINTDSYPPSGTTCPRTGTTTTAPIGGGKEGRA